MIGNRHVERHHLGVTRNALRENRLVIFGLCSIGLRRHGPFISCHIFLPLCFALSGTHLGSSFNIVTHLVPIIAQVIHSLGSQCVMSWKCQIEQPSVSPPGADCHDDRHERHRQPPVPRKSGRSWTGATKKNRD